MVVPFENYTSSPFYDADKDSPLGLDQLLSKLDNAQEAAIFDPKINADYVLYASPIPDTNFIAIGYREWRSVVTGITNISPRSIHPVPLRWVCVNPQIIESPLIYSEQYLHPTAPVDGLA